MGLPKPLLVVAVPLFVTSVLGPSLPLECASGTPQTSGPASRWNWYSILEVAATLLSGLVRSSRLLFWHYRLQESYVAFESSFF